MNCNRSLLPPLLWQSKINPDNLYARQTPNKGRQPENWSKVTLQYLTIRDPAWKVKEHMWWNNPARITEAYLSLRATEAEMLRAKTFSLLLFQQNWGSEAKYLVFLPEVDVTSLLLQTTWKTHDNNKERIMLIKVSSCSVPRVALLSPLSPGRVHTQSPFVRATAAKRWQYVADNIMHQHSHQSPQRRTVTIIQTPASREGRRGRAGDEKKKKTIRKKLGICRLSEFMKKMRNPQCFRHS